MITNKKIKKNLTPNDSLQQNQDVIQSKSEHADVIITLYSKESFHFYCSYDTSWLLIHISIKATQNLCKNNCDTYLNEIGSVLCMYVKSLLCSFYVTFIIKMWRPQFLRLTSNGR